jgi:hypothetical protein
MFHRLKKKAGKHHQATLSSLQFSGFLSAVFSITIFGVQDFA